MNVTEALLLLKEKGFKYTDKRKEMLELFSNSDKYLTARDVLQAMRGDHPGLSFDTVYRNLSMFEQLGILEMTELSGEKHYRFACPSTHHHHHFICIKCGRTKDLNICPMDGLDDMLKGFDICGHKFEIYGLCPKCIEM